MQVYLTTLYNLVIHRTSKTMTNYLAFKQVKRNDGVKKKILNCKLFNLISGELYYFFSVLILLQFSYSSEKHHFKKLHRCGKEKQFRGMGAIQGLGAGERHEVFFISFPTFLIEHKYLKVFLGYILGYIFLGYNCKHILWS